jgi:hypothetical protein
MPEVKFDTGVMPPLGAQGLEKMFSLDDMQPGQSFFHPCDEKFRQKLGAAVRAYAKRVEREFITKQLKVGEEYGSGPVTAEGLAVWRL